MNQAPSAIPSQTIQPKTAAKPEAAEPKSAAKTSDSILAIDVGGTGIKAALLSPEGDMLTERVRVETPKPCPPKVFLESLEALIKPLPRWSRVAVGFPGVVRRGKVFTAPNLGTEAWKGFDLQGTLTRKLKTPVRVLNDADLQGLAVIKGKGVELVLTLGTGLGSAIFEDGRLGPHLEISHHPFRKGETYDQHLGNAALEAVGKKRWNKRVERAIEALRILTNFDHLYLGGGNAKKVKFELDPNVKIVSNEFGIRGGARLWKQEAK